MSSEGAEMNEIEARIACAELMAQWQGADKSPEALAQMANRLYDGLVGGGSSSKSSSSVSAPREPPPTLKHGKHRDKA